MKKDPTSPILRSSRGRHHKRKFSIGCTPGKLMTEPKYLLANNTIKVAAFQNLESHTTMSNTMQKEAFQEEIEKSTDVLECSQHACPNSTPEKRKKQKLSFTPNIQVEQSICKESPHLSVYSAALDDSLMTCNIDYLLDSLEDKIKPEDLTKPHQSIEKTPKISDKDTLQERSTSSTDSCATNTAQGMQNAIDNTVARQTNLFCKLSENFLNETYTSPNRFQIKVRRKLSTGTEKCQSSSKLSSHVTTGMISETSNLKEFNLNIENDFSKPFNDKETHKIKSAADLCPEKSSECTEIEHPEKSLSFENIDTILQDFTLLEALNESFNFGDKKDGNHSNPPRECSPDLFAEGDFHSSRNVANSLTNRSCHSDHACSNDKTMSSNTPSQGKAPLSENNSIFAHETKSLNSDTAHVTMVNETVSQKIIPEKENFLIDKSSPHDTKVPRVKNPTTPSEESLSTKSSESVMANILQEADLLIGPNRASLTGQNRSRVVTLPHADLSKNLKMCQKRLISKNDVCSPLESLPNTDRSPDFHDRTCIGSPTESTNSELKKTSNAAFTKLPTSKVCKVPGAKSVFTPNSTGCNTSKMKTQPEKSKDNNESSEVKSPGSNCSLVTTLDSDCSTLQSQNLLQKMRAKLYSDTQSTTGSAHTTQLSASLNASGVLRNAAITAAVQLVHKAADADGALGYELGPFFGLPSTVLELFHKHRGITGLYDWQSECIKQGLSSNNLLISLPTSGGKTLVAEVLMLRTLLVRKKHAIFLLPYVAIVQEKVRGLAPLAVELDFLLEEYAGSRGSYPPKKRMRKSVAYVATTEKASGLINSFLEEGRAEEVGLVVVDEAHMLGERGGRGALLEGAITKLRHSAKHVQIVAMSATISNLGQLSEFLGAELYTGNFRPVKLRQFVKMNDMISEINPAALTDEELLFNHRSVDYGYSSSERARDQDGIGGLVREVVPQHSVLVFCPTRRNCESVAKLLCTLLPRSLTLYNRSQKEALYKALAKEGGGSVCPVLREVLPYGIAYHHSGLTEGERKLVEEGYLSGTLCLITCTSTLAAGVNLPARRVILRSPYTGRDPLTRSRYMQMVGRAGRAGLDSVGESFLIMQKTDARMIPDLVRGPVETCLSRLCDAADEATAPYSHATARPQPLAYSRRLASSTSAVAPAASVSTDSISTAGTSTSSTPGMRGEEALTSNCGLRDLVFSSIGLGLVNNLAQALELVQCSLMALQAPQRNVNLRAMVVDVLENLRSYGMLRIKESASVTPAQKEGSQPSVCGTGSGLSDASQPSTYSSISSLASSEPFESALEDLRDPCARVHTPLLPHHTLAVSRLGRAAVKGCVELSIASRLYEDLMVARNSLAVHSRLHLLYLVTPYSAAHELPLVPQAFYQAYCALRRDEAQAAELIGVGEAVAAKVAMGKTKTIKDEAVKRFNAAIILHRLLAGEDVWKVSEKFEVPRGLLQRTLAAAAAFASCVHHFCQELEELWAFRDLLVSFSRQLSGCCASHLLPLMDLPAVKLGRARLLYAAGFTSLHAIANADPEVLVKAVHHLPRATATQMVHSAKALLLEKAEALQEEAEQVLLGLVHFSPGSRSALPSTSQVT